ncbi:hypothetical protein Tco_0826113 [Tanacetum coccineum]
MFCLEKRFQDVTNGGEALDIEDNIGSSYCSRNINVDGHDGVRDAEYPTLSHPPGFKPLKLLVTHANVGEICEDGPTNGEDMVNMPRVDAKVMDHSQEVHDSSNGESVSSFSHKVHNGGSILVPEIG